MEKDQKITPDPAFGEAERGLEDDACPVDVESDVDYATPAGWNWKRTDASQPSKATFHINHSEVTQALPDVLRPSDCPPDAPFVLTRDIPVIIIDSLDQYWVGESRHHLPLHGLRVPIAADTLEEAKRALAADLAAQMRLLLLLFTSYKERMAPQLKDNLDRLRSVMTVNPGLR